MKKRTSAWATMLMSTVFMPTVIMPTVFMLSAPAATAQAAQTTTAPAKNSSNDLASALFRMGSMPDSLQNAMSRKSGAKQIYNWQTPGIGKIVKSNWNSFNDWMIQISVPTFKGSDLGKAQTVKASSKISRITDGPLKGVYIQENVGIRLYSQAWYSRLSGQKQN